MNLTVIVDGRRYDIVDATAVRNQRQWVQQCITRGDTEWHTLADGSAVWINWGRATTVEVRGT